MTPRDARGYYDGYACRYYLVAELTQVSHYLLSRLTSKITYHHSEGKCCWPVYYYFIVVLVILMYVFNSRSIIMYYFTPGGMSYNVFASGIFLDTLWIR